MWKTAAQDAKDPVRVAYCQGRVSDLVKRITLVRLFICECVSNGVTIYRMQLPPACFL